MADLTDRLAEALNNFLDEASEANALTAREALAEYQETGAYKIREARSHLAAAGKQVEVVIDTLHTVRAGGADVFPLAFSRGIQDAERLLAEAADGLNTLAFPEPEE